jgi:hypothetical protein
MARLTIAWMSVLATLLVVTTCYYVIKGDKKSDVVLALGGMLLTVVAKGAVAIYNRNSDPA